MDWLRFCSLQFSSAVSPFNFRPNMEPYLFMLHVRKSQTQWKRREFGTCSSRWKTLMTTWTVLMSQLNFDRNFQINVKIICATNWHDQTFTFSADAVISKKMVIHHCFCTVNPACLRSTPDLKHDLEKGGVALIGVFTAVLCACKWSSLIS